MSKVIVIAEAGVNHNGSEEIAKSLIDVASESGADFVKFQTFKATKLTTKKATLAKYQAENLVKEESQYEMLRRLELSDKMHHSLIEHCQKRNIKFLSSIFDHDSCEFLNELDMGLFKIPSGEINNYPLLKKVANFNKEVILSTGMCTLGEVEEAINLLERYGLEREKISILHCNTDYPTKFSDVNLLAMKNMGQAFNLKYGYSDHTPGIEIPIAAVALGAEIIEKHFTLDKSFEGPDHKASLAPDELKEMISKIRNIEVALGDGLKKPSRSELQNKIIVRKSIVASRDILTGEIFTEENITVKRPGHGLSPMLWEEVVGKRAKKDFKEDECIIL